MSTKIKVKKNNSHNWLIIILIIAITILSYGYINYKREMDKVRLTEDYKQQLRLDEKETKNLNKKDLQECLDTVTEVFTTNIGEGNVVDINGESFLLDNGIYYTLDRSWVFDEKLDDWVENPNRTEQTKTIVSYEEARIIMELFQKQREECFKKYPQ